MPILPSSRNVMSHAPLKEHLNANPFPCYYPKYWPHLLMSSTQVAEIRGLRCHVMFVVVYI
jgi:hypothetical protein